MVSMVQSAACPVAISFTENPDGARGGRASNTLAANNLNMSAWIDVPQLRWQLCVATTRRFNRRLPSRDWLQTEGGNDLEIAKPFS
jgi:hypothetical protein